MESQYITIKEFARRAGVSTQAIYQRLDKDLQAYLQVIDNRKKLDIKGLELFLKKEEQQEPDKDLIKTLQDTINLLGRQLAEKDKQIEELHRFLDQQQQLQAQTNQQILKALPEPEATEQKKKAFGNCSVNLVNPVNRNERRRYDCKEFFENASKWMCSKLYIYSAAPL